MLFLFCGIAYSCVVYCLQSFLECRLYNLNIAECQWALVELAAIQFHRYHILDEIVNILGCILFDTVRRSLYAVGKHKYCLFACRRLWAGIGEYAFVKLLAGVRVFVCNIEISGF